MSAVLVFLHVFQVSQCGHIPDTPGYPRIPPDTPAKSRRIPLPYTIRARTPGFYHRRWGTVTGDYESACREQGFKLWVGPNSKQGPRAQPPDVADVVLHETAISWLRVEEEQTRPTRPWEETPKQLAVRLQRGVSRINKDFDVRGLCMEFPDRLHTLVKKKGGDRLPK